MTESTRMAGDRPLSPKKPWTAVIEPSLRVGAVCGTAGFLFGGAAGILKGTTPFLFGAASGLQTFALGTTFFGTRSTILQAWTVDQRPLSRDDLIKASAVSGGITGGAVALITRGRSNIIPGALMFSLFGCLGQMAYNRFRAARDTTPTHQEGFWKRMSEKSWSPVQIMSDEDYAALLREKMLKVDVEISVLDDKIAALRKQQEVEEQSPTVVK